MTSAIRAPEGDELLDHPDADPAAVRQSLHHIARANFWFGGWWAVRRGLARLLEFPGAGAAGSLTVLDVGCGSADLLRRAVRWAARRGIRLVPIGLERHRTAASLARAAGIPTILGSAAELPLRQHSVDIVLASQLLHHFAPETIIDFCRSAGRLARHGVVLADLRRSVLAQAGFRVGSRMLGFDPATRRDGITSVRRGFTDRTLADTLARAGVTARVERSPGFRLVATWSTATG